MQTVKFTRKAKQDLLSIIDYSVLTWGDTQAAKYIEGLEKRVLTLAQSPLLGRVCSDLGKGLLAFPYEKHQIYYLVQAHGISVVRVLHSNMHGDRQFLNP
jgi:toxin ParE1/3/4